MAPALTIAGMLLGCDGAADTRAPSREEPVRRAAFRSLVARDFLASCPGGGARAEMLGESGRHEELKGLAARKGAGRAVWLGENDYAAVRPHADREPCEPGEERYREALAAYRGTLDELAGRVAEYRE